MASTLPRTDHPGMILGVARFYHDPRGSMRSMLESNPGEARLLAYAMIAAAIQLAGRLALLTSEAQENLTARVIEQSVSLLFFLPLVYYAFAAIGTYIARKCGGTGNWFTGRAAFFWAALVSAPLVLFSTLAGAILEDAPVALRFLTQQIGPLFFAWALSKCFAETFGFRRDLIVLATVLGTVIAFVGAAFVIGQLFGAPA